MNQIKDQRKPMSYQNLIEIFYNSVQKRKENPCFRYKKNGEWQDMSWTEAYDSVLTLCSALQKLGLKRNDKVAIFSKTRYEWTLADLGILSSGGVTVPIYESSLPEQAYYILDNADVKLAFVEDEKQLEKVLSIQNKLPKLKQIIVFDLKNEKLKGDGVYLFKEMSILSQGNGEEIFHKMKSDIQLDDLASLVYTSGTTGNPKGAMLSHRNFVSEVYGLSHNFEFDVDDICFLFLPLAHIFARAVQFAQIQSGFVQAYAESIDRLLDNLSEVKPHLMPSVPRIFEKVHTRVLQGVESGSSVKKKIFNWAQSVANQRKAYLNKGKGLPLLLQVQWNLAFKLVFSKLHEKLGGRIKYFISGGAPLSTEIGDFFTSADFLILEAYGLTETTAGITANSKEHQKIGTVGRVLKGLELKIAEDGEILVRGGVVFKGYFKNEEATKKAIDGDSWFHTGDIGHIDEDGFLKITDRKKDIIITAAGKNIAPQNIENHIKTDPMISQVMVHGDQRKFLSALITLDQDEITSYAKSKGIRFKSYKDLIKHDAINKLIKDRIESKNKALAKYETIKKFAILDQDFSIETGELTPTLKIKRKFTSEKYKDILDSFYTD